MKELSDCRVLIVDDVKANVDILVQALSGEYKLSVALGGQQALDAVHRSAPDLVLLDIMMPDIDGYEICRRLRASAATRELPIMFLSSLEDVKDKARGFEVGGNDYLTKPFEVLEVKARVRSLLKAKSYADAVREAAERDLRIAREIQTGLLPANVPAQVSGTGLDVHAVLEPAHQVGGDLYEVLRLDADRVLVAVGDVSGKGIPAALFMAVTMTLLRSMARQGKTLEVILRELNDELLAQNPRGMFVTLQCLVFDLADGSVDVRQRRASRRGPHRARAGSPAGIRLDGMRARIAAGRRRSAPRRWHCRRARPSCSSRMESARPWTRMASSSEKSDCWITCGASPARSARETSLGVLDAVRRHAAGAKQSDDITVVSVRNAGRA